MEFVVFFFGFILWVSIGEFLLIIFFGYVMLIDFKILVKGLIFLELYRL